MDEKAKQAIEALKAAAPDIDSPLPWQPGTASVAELGRPMLRDANLDRVGTFPLPMDRDYALACVRAAPYLLAEVERLHGLVATGDRLRAEDAMDALKAQARVTELESALETALTLAAPPQHSEGCGAPCNCGGAKRYKATQAAAKLRLSELGLEVKP
jgi:hypothetical protein